MRLTRALNLLLALALLAAWHGALLHPLRHSDSRQGLIHVAGAPVPQSPDGGGGANALCDVLAAVAVCVGNAAAAPPASLAQHASPTPARASAPGAPSLLAYHSQAPPALL